MERILQQTCGPHLAAEQRTGDNQFAYKTQKGARDALAFLVLTWVTGFRQARKYVLYCSDVSGAFDKVRLERLEEKLRAKKVPERWVKNFSCPGCGGDQQK